MEIYQKENDFCINFTFGQVNEEFLFSASIRTKIFKFLKE